MIGCDTIKEILLVQHFKHGKRIEVSRKLRESSATPIFNCKASKKHLLKIFSTTRVNIIN
jgi:hypothetical protein